MFKKIMQEKTRAAQQKYLDNLRKIFGQTKTMQLIEVEFDQPWWMILTKLKYKLSLLWIVGGLNGVFWIIFPILVVKCLESNNFTNFVYLILARILVILLSLIPYRFEPEVFQQLYWSVSNSATRFFLTVDPINHSLRSTGTIISKVQRGRDSYNDFLALITWEILPLCISFITVILVFLSVDFWLALASFVSLLSCVILTVACQWLNAGFTRKLWIEQEDTAKAFGVENLQQMQFIRSTFATVPQLDIQTKMTQNLMQTNRVIWLAYIWLYHIPLIVYYLSIIWVGYLIFHQIGQNNITVAVGAGLMGTYFLGSNNITDFGEKAKRLSEKITDIADLFDFIRGFGQQTFPVLETELKSENLKLQN